MDEAPGLRPQAPCHGRLSASTKRGACRCPRVIGLTDHRSVRSRHPDERCFPVTTPGRLLTIAAAIAVPALSMAAAAPAGAASATTAVGTRPAVTAVSDTTPASGSLSVLTYNVAGAPGDRQRTRLKSSNDNNYCSSACGWKEQSCS